MFTPPQFDEMTKSLLALLPESAKQAESALKEGFKEVLTNTFSKLDLVTREEFDVQVKVLARTRAKLEALEAQLDALQKEVG